MIHLALLLIALVVVLGAVGCTFSVIAAAFSEHFILGIVALLGAGVFWVVVLAFVL